MEKPGNELQAPSDQAPSIDLLAILNRTQVLAVFVLCSRAGVEPLTISCRLDDLNREPNCC